MSSIPSGPACLDPGQLHGHLGPAWSPTSACASAWRGRSPASIAVLQLLSHGDRDGALRLCLPQSGMPWVRLRPPRSAPPTSARPAPWPPRSSMESYFGHAHLDRRAIGEQRPSQSCTLMPQTPLHGSDTSMPQAHPHGFSSICLS